MKRKSKRVLFWSPRILCILFAVFLSLFSLDVFGEGQSIGQTILALLIHLIPVYVVIIVLILAWRWEWIGAVLFCALSVLYLALAWGRFHWSAYLGISGPLFLTGVLFFFSWLNRTPGRRR